MEYYGILWNSMGCHGIPSDILACHGIPASKHPKAKKPRLKEVHRVKL